MTKQQLLEHTSLTKKESMVIDYLWEELSNYFGEHYSDVDVNDIAKDLELNTNTVKGVVGSLCKKDILGTYDTGNGYDVVNFINQDDLEY